MDDHDKLTERERWILNAMYEMNINAKGVDLDNLTALEHSVLICMSEMEMDEAASLNDDEGVKELATIIRKLGGGK